MRVFIILSTLFTHLAIANSFQAKVATINVWQKLSITSPKDSRARLSILCKSIKTQIKQVDAIGIQELWNRSIYRKLLKCLKKSDIKINYAHSKNAKSFFFWKRDGLLLLTRHKIRSKTFYKYKTIERRLKKKFGYKFEKDISEVTVNKGFQFVAIEIPTEKGSETIHVYNTHLAANFGDGKKGRGNRQALLRKVQLKYLISKVEKLSNKVPTFLIGDFNYALNGLKERKKDKLEGSSLHGLVKKELGFKEMVNYPKKDKRSIHTYSSENSYSKLNLGQLDHVFCGILDRPDQVKHISSKLFMDKKFIHKKKQINISDHFGLVSSCKFN